jgi:2-methylcitrate dehydratase PrpD
MTGDDAPAYEDIAAAVLDAASRPPHEDVVTAARRTLFNVLAVALGASRAPQLTRLAAVLAAPSGVPAAPGVRGNASPADAALITGFAGHLDDFDDTHLATVIHPGASVLGVAWAAGWPGGVPGADLLTAFALGCEVQLRLGLVVSPEHYDRGWHSTGTCGVIGAAVTAGLLGSLGRDRLADALRLASLQTLGHREAFGTEVKPFHAGKAAANGLLAAEEAARGRFATGAAAMPDIGGLLGALAPDHRSPGRLLDGFGTRWELLDNTFKPYPCGIVAHPGIDAAIQAYGWGIAPQDVVEIRYRCHPLVPELMGRLDPGTGLQARFSAVHAVAAGLVRGAGGLAEFSDVAATDPVLSAMRSRIEMCPEAELPRDSAILEIRTADGRGIESAIEHARGSLPRPLTDHELIDKADSLAPGRAQPIWEAIARLAKDTAPWTLQAALRDAGREVPVP